MTRLINRAILVALATTALSGAMVSAAMAQTDPDAAAPVATAPGAQSSSPSVQPAYSPPPPAETVQPAALPPVNRPPVTDRNVPPGASSEGPAINTAPEPPLATPVSRPRVETRYTIAGKVEASAEKNRALRVEKGDTVKSLAEHFMATKTAIIEANKLKKPYELEIGQALKIPTPKVYVVGSGDTLYGIGRRFGVPADLLAELNDLEVGARLRAGAKIILPQDFKDKGPIAERVVETARDAAPETARAVPPERPRTYQRIDAPPSGGTSYQPQGGVATAPAYTPPAVAAEIQPAPLTDAQISAAGQGRFTWPLRGDILSGFGPTADGQRNDGLDIAAPLGTPIQAAAAGDVVYAGTQVPGFGTLVLIQHDGGWVTVYTHLSKTLVRIKDHVSQGDVLGEVGQTGGVAQPELHFEVRMRRALKQKAMPINPLLVLPK